MKLEIDQILEQIDEIDWGIMVGRPFLPPPVSRAFCDLFSETTTELEKACRFFDHHFLFQGNLHPGAFYITPFLVASLCTGIGVGGREKVYEILGEIGRGTADLKDTVSFERFYESFHYFKPSGSGVSLPLEIACHNAVSEGLPIYLSDLDKNEECLSSVLDLVYCFPQFYELAKGKISELLRAGNPSEHKFKLLRKAQIELRRSKF